MKKDIVVVIPAYEPNQSLLQVLDGVTASISDCSIVLIDDGSTESKDIFEKAEKYGNLTLLRHPQNKGKGAALKTAFSYIKEQGGDKIIVTADADGQHKPEDIQKVADTYLATGEGLVLGSRKFEGKIPFKSTFGNVVARGLLRLCNHRRLHDTQTGLRAFGSELLPFMLSIAGNKYEYEMNMLVRCLRCDVPIKETAIATVYIDNNSATHFRPVRDFCRICAIVLQYALPFILAIIANLVTFCVLQCCGVSFSQNACTNATIVCAIGCGAAAAIYCLAQLLAGIITKDIKRQFTLKKIFKTLLIIAILCVIDCGIVSALVACSANLTAAKIIIDIFTLILFCIVSYASAENKTLYE